MKRTRIGALLGIGALAAMTLSTSVTATRSHDRSPDCYGGDGYDRGGHLAVVGLTSDQKLFCFRANDPDNARTIGYVSGLSGDTKLVGIDFRTANKKLYGVGQAGGIYIIDERTAAATKIDQLDIALDGNWFGVDFNPAADALRIVSDKAQNLRHPFSPATPGTPGPTVMDGTLTYPAAGATAAKTATGVVGAAYTNNDTDPNTGTTLFDIDHDLDQVVIQSPANSGLLAATGKLGVDTTANVGFDIYSKIRNGTTVSAQAFASLWVDGKARFYSIDLLTGDADKIGSFGYSKQAVDIAIPLEQR